DRLRGRREVGELRLGEEPALSEIAEKEPLASDEEDARSEVRKALLAEDRRAFLRVIPAERHLGARRLRGEGEARVHRFRRTLCIDRRTGCFDARREVELERPKRDVEDVAA